MKKPWPVWFTQVTPSLRLMHSEPPTREAVP